MVAPRSTESRSGAGRNNWASRRVARTTLMEWWEVSCTDARLGTARCRTATARRFVDAVILELAAPSASRQLGERTTKASHSWISEIRGGDDIPATFQAVTALREAFSDGRSVLAFGWSETAVHRVFDALMADVAATISGSLQDAAFTDPLTGAGNRRGLDVDLPAAIAAAIRAGRDLTVAVMDLDGLKEINDSQGHAAGDRALQALSRAAQESFRTTDRLYRIGGDEFVAVLAFTDFDGASEVMIRMEAAGAPSFSWGVASLSMMTHLLGIPASPGVVDPNQLITAADAELYAKRRASRGVPEAAARTESTAAQAHLSALISMIDPSPAGLARAAAAELRDLYRIEEVPTDTTEARTTAGVDADLRDNADLQNDAGLRGDENLQNEGLDERADAEDDEGVASIISLEERRLLGRRLGIGVAGIAASVAAVFAVADMLGGGTSARHSHEAAPANRALAGLPPYQLQTGTGVRGGGAGAGGPGGNPGFWSISSGSGLGASGGAGSGWGAGPGGGGAGSTGGSPVTGGSGGGSGSGGSTGTGTGSGSGGSGGPGGSGGGSNPTGGGSNPPTSGDLLAFLNALLNNPTGALQDPAGTAGQAVSAVQQTVGGTPAGPVVTSVTVPVTVPSAPVPTTVPSLPSNPVTTVTSPASPTPVVTIPPAPPVTSPSVSVSTGSMGGSGSLLP